MTEVSIPTLHLFLPLDQKLIELLKSLSVKEWNKPTVAKLWSVKDIAAHLLDGNMRVLAAKQNYTGEPPDVINSYQDLVTYLNRLNADWVKAMKRVSPETLISLLEVTQKPCIEYYRSLNLWETARFSVSWAGETESQNWFHIAREYTERWHHQQQIRDAVNKQGIMDRIFFFPLIQTFMQALPHSYRNIQAPVGTLISIQVTGESGGVWKIMREVTGWKFSDSPREVKAKIELDPDTSWKLFTNALSKDEAVERVKISGDQTLAIPIFKMLSVMA